MNLSTNCLVAPVGQFAKLTTRFNAFEHMVERTNQSVTD